MSDDLVVRLRDLGVRSAREAADAIERLKAENARLRAALRPFAKLGELFPERPSYALTMSIYRPAAGGEYELTCEHLRAARAAYEGKTDGQ